MISSEGNGISSRAILLIVLMLLQSAPLLTVSASTTPPQSAGDWTINSNEVAYLNSSDQAVVQGDVLIYGELNINGGSLFLWGSYDSQRELIIYPGGSLNVINGGILGSFTSTKYDVEVKDFAHITVTDSRIEKTTPMVLSSLNMTFRNVHFEDSTITLSENEETGIFNSTDNTTRANLIFENLQFRNSTSANPVLNLNSIDSNLADWTITFTDINISRAVLTSGISYSGDYDIEIGGSFDSNLVFDGLIITDPNNGCSNCFPSQLIYNQHSSNHLDIRNALFYDSSERTAIYSNGNISLSNVTINDLFHPNENADAYSGFDSNCYQCANDNIHRIITANSIVSDRLIINNSGVMTLAETGYQFYTYGNLYGADFKCEVIHSTYLVMTNSTISNNCIFEIEYDTNGYVFGYSRAYCEIIGTQIEGYQSNDIYCRTYEASALDISHSAHISDSSIISNSFIGVEYNNGNPPASNSYCAYHHGFIRAVGAIFHSNSTVENTTISDNGLVSISSYCGSTSTGYYPGHEILSTQVVANLNANEVIYINNSFMNASPHSSSLTYSNYNQNWLTLTIDSGTVFVIDTEINYDTSPISHTSTSSSSDINPGDGEAVRSWTVEVNVVDPDYQYTPFANVTVYENNGVWNVGTWSTGPTGSSVNFIGRQYSLTASANYSYTPHSIQVSMTNYSNSTSVNITGPTVVTVYDPTPDAFPGDITQDWDTDGDGYGDNISGNNPDHFPNDSTQWNDTDGDGWGDNYAFSIDTNTGLRIQNNGDAFPTDSSQWSDLDGDGYGDNYTFTIGASSGLRYQSGDAFPYDSTQFSDIDGDGFGDNQLGNNPDEFIYDVTQWSDLDGDGWGDNYTWFYNLSTSLRDSQNGDAFINEPTQWSDIDGDGYGDNSTGVNPDIFPQDGTQWVDADQDGLGDNQSGNNPDPYLNDSDNDGYNNSIDLFPWNPTQWEDNDNDGLGDNQSGTAADPYLNDTDNDGYNNTIDDFPFDSTQWEDADNDGYGDNPNGTNPDPSLNDSDNDGVSNSDDDFPWNPTQTTDSDGDGYGDNLSGHPADAFPNDSSQWIDSDGDGHGDNANGYSGDHFPSDPTQWSDSDGDGFGDNPLGNSPDAFPYDPTQWADLDGDGWGDEYKFIINSSTGLRDQTGDAFPLDATQWSDLDGDGYGDNLLGNSVDWSPYDPTQWADSDGDGSGDNYHYDLSQTPQGLSNTYLRENQQGDAFPNDPLEIRDTDGDGYGDNSDWSPMDHTQWIDEDNDGYGDNPLGTNPDPTPGDGDNDGFRDSEDAFPQDPLEAFDTDNDGIGDNADTDDDNDGWTDAQEIDCQTSPYDSTSTPLDIDLDSICNWLDDDDDGDGYLDSEDSCPQQSGNSSYILTACLDSDGDSVADVNDVWPNNPYLSLDSDGDGIHDPIDSFPDDGTQWYDNDNDGFGDNPNGNNPDPHLDDTDNDGYSNQFDDFPLDSTQWLDSDNDGLGDNPEGNNPDPSINDSDNDGYTNDVDLFRLDPTQWADSDGDGYGDNPGGIYGDQFPNNPSQCCDRDFDGWGDNFNGTQRDMFPDEPTQWIDTDGDGLGDNPSGINGDPYPGDTDNDGVPNEVDIFPEDPTRTLDNDGDGLAVEDEGEILDNIHETDLPMILASAFVCLLLGSIIGGTMAIRIKKE